MAELKRYERIKDIETGEKGIVSLLFNGVTERTPNPGNTYVDLDLSDIDGLQINAKKWKIDKETLLAQIPLSTVVDVQLHAQEYKGNRSYIAEGIRPSKKPFKDFVKTAPVEAEEVFQEMREAVPEDNAYGMIIRKLLDDWKDTFLTQSGAQKIHHAYLGGLLYHTYCVYKNSLMIAEHYNLGFKTKLDIDLLKAGAILHDIGKLKAQVTDAVGNSEYTLEGTLIGHVILGYEMIDEAIRVLKEDEKFNPEDEKILLLKHMILAHHGALENGSPVAPLIPEAQILHEADMLDFKIDLYETALDTMDEGEVSENNWILKHRFYKAVQPKNDAK